MKLSAVTSTLGIAFSAIASLGSMDSEETYHAIGIDLSPSFIYASQYDMSTGNFSVIAKVSPPEHYANFIWELYFRQKAHEQSHAVAWRKFEADRYRKTILDLKRVLEASRMTSWLSGWLPNAIKNEDFRYKVSTSPDEPISFRQDLSWLKYVWGYGPSTFKKSSAKSLEYAANPPEFPLNSTNLMSILTETFQRVKSTAFASSSINITAAVISKPNWIYNELDRLLEQAAFDAGIEMFTQEARYKAAMRVATESGSTNPLVIEQTDVGFSVYRESMTLNQVLLGKAFIPHILLGAMLNGKRLNGTAEDLIEATFRLRAEIMRARSRLYCENGPLDKMDETSFRESLDDKPGLQITVPGFGEPGYTLDEYIPFSSLRKAETDYIEAVEEAVGRALLRSDEVLRYMTLESILDETFLALDHDAKWRVLFDFARHNTEAIGESWWEPMDALLVLADVPDKLLILKGAKQALQFRPGLDSICGRRDKYIRPDLPARGAALQAADYVKERERERLNQECDLCYERDEGHCHPECSSDNDLDEDSVFLSHEEL